MLKLHPSHSRSQKIFGAQPPDPHWRGARPLPRPPCALIHISGSAPVFTQSVYLLEVYMARHVDIQCILLLALHNRTPRACSQPPTEDTAFSTFILLVVLNFDQSRVKYILQSTENYSQQWLSDSSRVHQIRFRPGLRPEPHWGSLLRSAEPRIVGWGRGYPLPTPQLRK